nr:MAG TPA: hypothetical protein [Caudoviricetes sp.]
MDFTRKNNRGTDSGPRVSDRYARSFFHAF